MFQATILNSMGNVDWSVVMQKQHNLDELVSALFLFAQSVHKGNIILPIDRCIMRHIINEQKSQTVPENRLHYLAGRRLSAKLFRWRRVVVLPLHRFLLRFWAPVVKAGLVPSHNPRSKVSWIAFIAREQLFTCTYLICFLHCCQYSGYPSGAHLR